MQKTNFDFFDLSLNIIVPIVRKVERMSNLPPAIFIGPLNAEKRFFGSKSEKMTFPTKSHRRRWQQVLRLLPKKAAHVAKNFRSCKGCSQLSVEILWHPGTSWSLRNLIFCKKVLKKTGTLLQ